MILVNKNVLIFQLKPPAGSAEPVTNQGTWGVDISTLFKNLVMTLSHHL